MKQSNLYKPEVNLFYTPQQVCAQNIERSSSKSPLKPKLLLEYWKGSELNLYPNMKEKTFVPFEVEDLYIAHTTNYVDNFFAGVEPICSSNGLPWSEELASSVRYTNSSLYNAVRHSLLYPNEVCFSPTSGFHHARPNGGSGFCTFSGQVIASVKLYREFGARGAWLDLDGHFGNSIEDSRTFVTDLNLAVPHGFNINPSGSCASYVGSFKKELARVKEAIVNGDIDYVVFCHGADSHQWDDLGYQLSTEDWAAVSRIFYKWVLEVNEATGKHLPVSLALFGGYRSDDYQSVLNLHTADMVTCLNYLCNHNIKYKPIVKPKSYAKRTANQDH